MVCKGILAAGDVCLFVYCIMLSQQFPSNLWIIESRWISMINVPWRSWSQGTMTHSWLQSSSTTWFWLQSSLKNTRESLGIYSYWESPQGRDQRSLEEMSSTFESGDFYWENNIVFQLTLVCRPRLLPQCVKENLSLGHLTGEFSISELWN